MLFSVSTAHMAKKHPNNLIKSQILINIRNLTT